MLCLKTEVLHDDLDNNQPSNVNAETGSAATSGGFVLPINLGGSIHKYLWRIGKVTTTPITSTRSVSSGDGSPTFSDLESVEEAECRRAYDTATEVYMSSFDRSKPPEEVGLRESHEEAVQKSLAAFNASAVGVGSVRKKYEGLLQKFSRRAFECYFTKSSTVGHLFASMHEVKCRLGSALKQFDSWK
ncbi:hypothetical protein OIU84_026693 [Salix udensis]|uniref:Guanylate-binding protein/Atlastin C-terminal domain-containing protein n=1 Tax=Salix udensis TaxID=889485 RepID=A0AAD6PEH6_9ROSI|nr:hypothetical protein OIU84_026693 [Salix udensis]